jgi:hypothetical protein
VADALTADLGEAPDLAGQGLGDSVLQHHAHANRDGAYVCPTCTHAAAARTRIDPTFIAQMSGPTYAQPLYWDGGPNGRDLVIVATQRNEVTAFDAVAGAIAWRRVLGTPVPKALVAMCDQIDPIGITSTPIIDAASHTIYLDALSTPDGIHPRHYLHALDVLDGDDRAGWPIEVDAALAAAGLTFASWVQHQRGALALLGGTLYVPYGSFGDCGDYHGWVLAVPTATPGALTAFATSGTGDGIWAPAGIVSDGASLFVSTGNSLGAQSWVDGEAHLRLGPGATFSGLPADYFAPANWQQLDAMDLDIGGTAPLLVPVPGGTPAMIDLALGKDGHAYVLDPRNLGGLGGQLGDTLFADGEIISSAAIYVIPSGSYVAFTALTGSVHACPSNQGGNLGGLRVSPGNPPTVDLVWCGDPAGYGSPMVTTTDGTSDPVVWAVGAEGDNRLHAFDAETGAVLFAGGGGAEAMTTVQHFQTPIAAKGRIFVAGEDQLYAFTVQ